MRESCRSVPQSNGMLGRPLTAARAMKPKSPVSAGLVVLAIMGISAALPGQAASQSTSFFAGNYEHNGRWTQEVACPYNPGAQVRPPPAGYYSYTFRVLSVHRPAPRPTPDNVRRAFDARENFNNRRIGSEKKSPEERLGVRAFPYDQYLGTLRLEVWKASCPSSAPGCGGARLSVTKLYTTGVNATRPSRNPAFQRRITFPNSARSCWIQVRFIGYAIRRTFWYWNRDLNRFDQFRTNRERRQYLLRSRGRPPAVPRIRWTPGSIFLQVRRTGSQHYGGAGAIRATAEVIFRPGREETAMAAGLGVRMPVARLLIERNRIGRRSARGARTGVRDPDGGDTGRGTGGLNERPRGTAARTARGKAGYIAKFTLLRVRPISGINPFSVKDVAGAIGGAGTGRIALRRATPIPARFDSAQASVLIDGRGRNTVAAIQGAAGNAALRVAIVVNGINFTPGPGWRIVQRSRGNPVSSSGVLRILLQRIKDGSIFRLDLQVADVAGDVRINRLDGVRCGLNRRGCR